MKLSKQKGFTLVELLVVIAIIGILATLLILQLGVARQRARDAKRISDIAQIQSALELYFDDAGNYPNTQDLALLKPKYLTVIPIPPLSSGCGTTFSGNAANRCYGYAYQTGTTRPVKYHLWAELEQDAQALDADVDFDSGTGGFTGATTNGATETCADAAAIDCVYDIGQTQ